MVQHPWHEVRIGTNPPEYLNAIIETPRGSRAKYEIDKESGLIKLDRVIYASMYYPLNYGFIPQTLGKDHDPTGYCRTHSSIGSSSLYDPL